MENFVEVRVICRRNLNNTELLSVEVIDIDIVSDIGCIVLMNNNIIVGHVAFLSL